MPKLTFEQFVILSCLADYNFEAYEILGFAREMGYMIPLENLFPTIQYLLDLGLIQQYKTPQDTVLIDTSSSAPIHMQTFELTYNGTVMLLDEMAAMDLLIKRIRKQVRQLK